MKAKPKPASVAEYLASLNDEQRVALEKLRKTIRTAAPKAEECISYDIPSYRLNGRLLVAFAAAKKHCSFFPGALPVATHQDELKNYSTSKGTVRFLPDQPLPAALVRKLVKTRIAERGTAK
jgi:uncharacterized protein YdhG (YjbR/CyaY superfamily)